jgi:hypothetical protein
VGHDMAREAEAASPLNGRKIWEITALTMCNGQHPVKSLQRVTIAMTSRIPSKVNKIISQRKIWDYDCFRGTHP